MQRRLDRRMRAVEEKTARACQSQQVAALVDDAHWPGGRVRESFQNEAARQVAAVTQSRDALWPHSRGWPVGEQTGERNEPPPRSARQVLPRDGIGDGERA